VSERFNRRPSRFRGLLACRFANFKSATLRAAKRCVQNSKKFGKISSNRRSRPGTAHAPLFTNNLELDAVTEIDFADQLEILSAFECSRNADFDHRIEADLSSAESARRALEVDFAALSEAHGFLDIRDSDRDESAFDAERIDDAYGQFFASPAGANNDTPIQGPIETRHIEKRASHPNRRVGRKALVDTRSTSIMLRTLAVVSVGVACGSFVRPSAQHSELGNFLSAHMSHFHRAQSKLTAAWHGAQTRRNGGMPLDAASSLDQASLTWSHRLAEQDIEPVVEPVERKKQAFDTSEPARCLRPSFRAS
jgi:hypothetical protein